MIDCFDLCVITADYTDLSRSQQCEVFHEFDPRIDLTDSLVNDKYFRFRGVPRRASRLDQLDC